MIQFKLIGKKYKMNYIIKNNNIIPTTTIKINFSRIIAISKEKNNCFLCYNNFYKYFFNPKNQKSLLKLFFKNILNKKLNKKLQKNLKLKNFYKINFNIDNKYKIGDFYYIKTINKENIDVQGLTIGKGFSGKIKRHNIFE